MGMGCLWGNVFAGAVLMPPTFEDGDKLVSKIKDSKKCSAKLRAKLAAYIEGTALAYGIGTASVEEIDNMNILHARTLAMHRAIENAQKMQVNGECPAFSAVVVDGDRFYPPPHAPDLKYRCVVQGDATHLNVAAASVLAKHHRDCYVLQAVAARPELQTMYGFETNKGYGTAKHMQGLAAHGPSELHRMSFAPCRISRELHALSTYS